MFLNAILQSLYVSLEHTHKVERVQYHCASILMTAFKVWLVHWIVGLDLMIGANIWVWCNYCFVFSVFLSLLFFDNRNESLSPQKKMYILYGINKLWSPLIEDLASFCHKISVVANTVHCLISKTPCPLLTNVLLNGCCCFCFFK